MITLPVSIERGAPVSIRGQIEAQLRHLIESGVLPGGTRLPTVRDLSVSLGVNRNTVQGVYQNLKRAGLLTAKTKHGTSVTTTHTTAGRPRPYRRLRELLQEILDLGFTPAEIAAIVQTEAGRVITERARQAEGLAVSRYRFATWGRYRGRGSPSGGLSGAER